MVEENMKKATQFDASLVHLIRNTFLEEQYITNPAAYFYDLSTISSNLHALQTRAPSQLKVYYAMKANSNPQVMHAIRDSGSISGVEIASAGELQIASALFPPRSIIFTGPGKTKFELAEAIKSGIYLINIESIVEAIRINGIAEELGIDNVNILIRVNLNYVIDDAWEHMSGKSTKMGIDEDAFLEDFLIIKTLPRVTVMGIHAFAASGVMDWRKLLKSNRYIFELVRKWESVTGVLPIIDFGGGIGIDYTNENRVFNTEKYLEGLCRLINEFGFEEKEMIMELGTYIVGNAGFYCAKIVDIKGIKGKKHIIIAGGVNHMGLPLEMRRKHPVAIVPMNVPKLYDAQPCVHNEIADISGPLCMVTDILCWDEYIEHAEIGDIVVFRQAGAYCYEEGMHTFLKHPLPDEIIIPCNVSK